jgi:aspartate 4-decarboxylase
MTPSRPLAERFDLEALGKLSPFELKDRLVALASSHAERVMLNAGRGNPNFFATVAHHAFFQLGLFAAGEAERCSCGLPEGVAGFPAAQSIAARFENLASARRDTPGIGLVAAALGLVWAANEGPVFTVRRLRQAAITL